MAEPYVLFSSLRAFNQYTATHTQISLILHFLLFAKGLASLFQEIVLFLFFLIFPATLASAPASLERKSVVGEVFHSFSESKYKRRRSISSMSRISVVYNLHLRGFPTWCILHQPPTPLSLELRSKENVHELERF